VKTLLLIALTAVALAQTGDTLRVNYYRLKSGSL
jgi:hypothetical protein